MPNFEELFFDLLDEVEQIPHPMAEQTWKIYSDMSVKESE
jgi:hypothetical protein